MRLPRLSFLLFLLMSVCMNVYARQGTLLKGTVHDRKSKALYLLTRTQNFRSEHKTEIPIVNGHFEYRMPSQELKDYRLVFKEEMDEGAWLNIEFFPDTTEVVFDLYPMKVANKNRVSGGSVNRDFYALMKDEEKQFTGREQVLMGEQHALSSKKQYYSAEYEALRAKAIQAKNVDEKQGYYEQMNKLEREGKHVSAEGKQWDKRNDSLQRDKISWKYTRMNAHTSFAYYYVLFEDAVYKSPHNPYLLPTIQETYQKYVELYPQHEYTRQLLDALNGLLQVFPGKPFVAFSAPDLQGKQYAIADLIKGKMALIDLWGSWCGPCIAKSRKVVPLYEKYRSKGFTVVGVAREFDDTKALEKRLQQEQFSWQHLVELNDQNGIWNKYGVQNNAGLFVLIDAEGKILAIDPTTEELTQYLSKLD